MLLTATTTFHTTFLTCLLLLLLLLTTTTHATVVNIEMTTTSCTSSCFVFQDTKCPSSIKINGEEESYRKDGFNIVLLDSTTGEVRKSAHIRWYNNLIFWRMLEFKKFFKSIPHNTTVLLTFQNMCKSFNKDWHRSLNLLTHNIPHKVYSYQAVVVACRGRCPLAAEESIPYTYYSSGNTFMKRLTLYFGGATPPPVSAIGGAVRQGASKPKSNIPTVAGVIAALVLTLTAVYAGYLYYRHKRAAAREYEASRYEYENAPQSGGQSGTPGVVGRSAENDLYSSEPIYEEIGPLVQGLECIPLVERGKEGNVYHVVKDVETKKGEVKLNQYDVPLPVLTPELGSQQQQQKQTQQQQQQQQQREQQEQPQQQHKEQKGQDQQQKQCKPQQGEQEHLRHEEEGIPGSPRYKEPAVV